MSGEKTKQKGRSSSLPQQSVGGYCTSQSPKPTVQNWPISIPITISHSGSWRRLGPRGLELIGDSAALTTGPCTFNPCWGRHFPSTVPLRPACCDLLPRRSSLSSLSLSSLCELTSSSSWSLLLLLLLVSPSSCTSSYPHFLPLHCHCTCICSNRSFFCQSVCSAS